MQKSPITVENNNFFLTMNKNCFVGTIYTYTTNFLTGYVGVINCSISIIKINTNGVLQFINRFMW